MAAPFEIGTGRQPNLAGDRCLRIRNHRSDVAATHVGLHHHAPFAILAADLVGTVDHLDLGDAGQRHIAAACDRHLHLLEQADVGALRLRQADHHREATIALEDLARGSPADRGSHGVLHVLRRNAQARHRVTIDANVEHGKTCRLLDFHVRGTLRLTQRRSDLLGRPVHLVEVVPEHLHRDVTAHAGDQLVEAHLDGLGDLVGIARDLRELTLDPADQLLLGKLRIRPILARLQDNEHVGCVRRHRVGRQLGGARLGIDELHLRLLRHHSLDRHLHRLALLDRRRRNTERLD